MASQSLVTKRGPKPLPAEERFGRFICEREGDECWFWEGSLLASGYGSFSRNHGRTVAAHRFAWEMANGPIPKGMCVLHRCDVLRCVRPDHLFLGTKRDNTRDMLSKGRGNGKLSKADIQYIRERHSGGDRGADIAFDFGVSRTHVWNIVTGMSHQPKEI